MLIGFAGKKGSGKTTAAAHLIDQGARSYSLAQPLKMLVGHCYQLSHEQLHGALKDVIDERYGKTPRQLLQEIGTNALRNYDEDIWIHCLRGFGVVSNMMTVIDDVRFPNEVEAIKKSGGLMIYVERHDLVNTDDHESETTLTAADFKYRLINDGSREQLGQMAMDMVKLQGLNALKILEDRCK